MCTAPVEAANRWYQQPYDWNQRDDHQGDVLGVHFAQVVDEAVHEDGSEPQVDQKGNPPSPELTLFQAESSEKESNGHPGKDARTDLHTQYFFGRVGTLLDLGRANQDQKVHSDAGEKYAQKKLNYGDANN